jgi:AcrR family transcriptional regulator
VQTETRTERRRRKIRDALIKAGYHVMSRKGIDAATMHEIAELADVGAGTVYNYFPSKEALAIAVLEKVMHRLAERIEAVTDTFEDPALAFAFGTRSVMRASIEDDRWRQLLSRPEVVADAMFRVMGPFALRDLAKAEAAGRYKIANRDVVWRITTHVCVGFGLSVVTGKLAPTTITDAAVALLAMVGVDPVAAAKIARRAWPDLPPE